jgi:hypothetical protein
MRSHTVPVVAAFLLLTASAAAAEPRPATCAESALFALPQRPYVAFRRLEAENPKTGKQAWMEVRTAVGADGVLMIEVLAEGGSEQIRNRVFRAALERERSQLAKRPPAQAMGEADTYECSTPVADASGLLRIPLRPGPKGGDNLVVGDMFLQPSTGDVVRVAGRLAKSPSFWVSHVDVEWSYARVHNDIVLPVSLQSTAKLKVFGLSTFRMTYDYLSVDGQPVASSTLASKQ